MHCGSKVRYFYWEFDYIPKSSHKYSHTNSYNFTLLFCKMIIVLTLFIWPLCSWWRRLCINLFKLLIIIIILNIFNILSIWQIDSKLQCVCSVIDHRWRQNMVRTKKWHTRRSQVCHWCSYHILTSSVIYYWTNARQLGIYLFYIIKN